MNMEGAGVLGIAPGKKAYSVFYGALDAKIVGDFVGQLTRGKAGLTPISGDIKPFSTVPAWDGKDFQLPADYYDDL